MEKSVCPHCGEATIKPIQKLKAAHWKDVYCNSCGGRSAMMPVALALLWFGLCWDWFFFGFMAYYEASWLYVLALVIGWGLLEFFGYYIPLVKLRPLNTARQNK